MFKIDQYLKKKINMNVKFRGQSYIKNQNEPKDEPAFDALAKDETVLVENSPLMRQRFRQIAKRIRIISIHGLHKNFRE